MQIRFSVSPPEIEITGARQDFRLLAAALRRRETHLAVNVPLKDPKPHAAFATGINIKLTLGKLFFSINEATRQVNIMGARKWRRLLADNLESLSSDVQPGESVRLDYFVQHLHLAEGSCPTILMLRPNEGELAPAKRQEVAATLQRRLPREEEKVDRPLQNDRNLLKLILELKRNSKNAIGGQLKILRKERKLSQEKLAVQCEGLGWIGVNENAICKIETHSRCVADYELFTLAVALNVGIAEFFRPRNLHETQASELPCGQ